MKENYPECSGCKRITRRRTITPYRLVPKLPPGHPFANCPLGDNCEAPPKCHAQIGIGVATLGADCFYPENHSGQHSYGSDYCKFHIDCQNKVERPKT